MNVGVVVGKRDDGLDADGQQYRDLCFHLRGPRLTSEGRKTRRQEPLVQDGEVVRVRGHWHMKGGGLEVDGQQSGKLCLNVRSRALASMQSTP